MEFRYLETDLLEISDTGKESVDDIAVFKERYRFAFQRRLHR